MSKNNPLKIGLGIGSNTIGITNVSLNQPHEPVCHPSETTETVILFTIASIGGVTNLLLMVLVIVRKPFKRYRRSWSQGLLLHQGLVDLARALLLIPLAISVLMCQRLSRCSIIDTAFLLLVTVSTVNMLTCLINDAPIFPEYEQLGSLTTTAVGHPRRDIYWMDTNNVNQDEANNGDSPYCIIFGIFIIWFASLTINLGPTFLSGALGSSKDTAGHLDVCPMVYRPVRHYVLNLLWISVNLMCVGLMAIHLRKLYKDIMKSNLEAARVASLVTTLMTVQSDREQEDQRNFYDYVQRMESEGISRLKMFAIILIAYLLFWGPLYTITLVEPGLETSLTYEISLHIALTHCFVNPILFLVMYSRGKSESSNTSGENNSCCGCFCCLSSNTSINNIRSPLSESSAVLPFYPTGNPYSHAYESNSHNSGNKSNTNNTRMETTI